MLPVCERERERVLLWELCVFLNNGGGQGRDVDDDPGFGSRRYKVFFIVVSLQ
jgi:hypothetical protein